MTMSPSLKEKSTHLRVSSPQLCAIKETNSYGSSPPTHPMEKLPLTEKQSTPTNAWQDYEISLKTPKPTIQEEIVSGTNNEKTEKICSTPGKKSTISSLHPNKSPSRNAFGSINTCLFTTETNPKYGATSSKGQTLSKNGGRSTKPSEDPKDSSKVNETIETITTTKHKKINYIKKKKHRRNKPKQYLPKLSPNGPITI
jgi:hypothetical protein